MVLKNLGAEIIKIERPLYGDDSRGFGPYIDGESIYFVSINRGKKSIEVDLKSDEGKKIFYGLLDQVDIITENFKPGTMEKLGLGYETLKEKKPEIIYAAMSGFGHTGPYSPRPAYDMIVQAMGGIMSITGQPGGEPTRVGTSVGDITAGMFGAIGILAALNHRNLTGEGQKVDIAMLDGQIAILENALARYSATGISPVALGSRHPSIAPFEAFKAQDDWIIIAVGNDKLWRLFCKVIDREEWIEDEYFATNEKRSYNHSRLKPMLDEVFNQRTVDEWMKLFTEANIPASPINNIGKLVEDEQVKSRHMLVDVEQPGIGVVKVAGNPIKLSSVASEDELPTDPAPAVGEHTSEILKKYLNYTDNEIQDYKKRINQ
jgi:CoA:oxalate CoA-transferase